jgi:hypothetical protein
MDPNEALAGIRTLVRVLREQPNTIAATETYEQVDSLLERIEGLDQWLSHGGFQPQDWALAHARAHGPQWIWMDAEYVTEIVRIRPNHDRNNVDLTDLDPDDRDEVMHIHEGEVGIRFQDEQGRVFILGGEVEDVMRAVHVVDGLVRRAWAEAQPVVTLEPLGPPDPAHGELPDE